MYMPLAKNARELLKGREERERKKYIYLLGNFLRWQKFSPTLAEA